MTELAERLRREGLLVGERVGTGPHRVDLAVTVPGHSDRWLVAVDGDGPGYATWRGTRERDRLWPQELERRGWRHLRVWSTDLYRDPARDVARIVTVVREEARALAGSGPAAPQAGAEGSETDESGPEAPGTGASESESLELDPGATTGDATEDPEAASDESKDPSAASEKGSKRQRRRAFRRGTTEATAPTDVAAQTTDDTDAGWGERRDDATHEQWLRDQRPPHWD